MISSSSLTSRVVILAPSVTRDSFGAQKTVFLDRGRVWAQVKFSKGSRALDAGDIWLQNSIVVTCRPHAALHDHCRLVWDGKTYQIDSYNRDRLQGSVTITASRIDTGRPDSESAG